MLELENPQLLDEHVLHAHFSSHSLEKGLAYYLAGHVSHFYHERLSAGELKIKAVVAGSQQKTYKTEIIVYYGSSEIRGFDSECSCPVAFDCKHVVASLYFALGQMQTITEPKNLKSLLATERQPVVAQSSWLEQFKQNLVPNVYKKKVKLHYLLSLEDWKLKKAVFVKLILELPSIGNKSRVWEDFSVKNNLLASSFSQEQQALVLQLVDNYHIAKQDNINLSQSYFPLVSANSGQILKAMLASRACFWEQITDVPLSLGRARKATWSWQINVDGSQTLQCNTKESSIILPTAPVVYLDLNKNILGEVRTEIDQAHKLLQIPAIPYYEIKEVAGIIRKIIGNANIIPKAHSLAKNYIDSSRLQPCLELFGSQQQRADCVGFAKLEFKYQQHLIQITDPREQIAIYTGEKLDLINRDLVKEQAYMQDLIALAIWPVAWSANPATLAKQQANQANLDFVVSLTREQIIDFNLVIIPQLKAQGWEIIVDASFPLYCIDEPDEWYSKVDELDEGSSYDWFKLEVGISIDGEQINILPILAKAIQSEANDLSTEYINSLDDNYKHLLPIDEGRCLAMPNHRLKGFLSILSELYNTEPNTGFKLSKMDAAQLYKLEMLFAATKLRWLGGDKLRSLGKKLANFSGIKAISLAKGLGAKLRTYQKEGVYWLNFLREYELGGILADDMGLGKTLQVLSLLQYEKEQGRLIKPCLIVAPTSLMANWAKEIEKFTPNLSLVILQGADRHSNYQEVNQYNIALTTYPLLVRDEEYLLQYNYYYLILDEAQNIKNFLSKAVASLHKISAQHRLCLSGTPMENHLGELWSLFHFALPGLLADYRTFNKAFKIPIEKHNDFLRKKCLANRLSPFMLRRTKEQVIKELPSKTLVIEKVHLGKEQRDLYESIRLAMELKIRQAIQQKGLKRSHIIILDALLKLRQVCNDPRLLKLKSARFVKTSAKLCLLKDLLKKLLKANKKVLIFSAFTSMLALIEAELLKNSILYSKLTGDTINRAQEVNAFQSGETEVFLLSLKAGGVGLNLTAADTVIHYDPWWNPAAEEQASDRAYRIGQDKPVTVYKLITIGSVEEKILEMQQNKLALLDGIFNSDLAETKSKLSEKDLAYLFQPLNAAAQ